MTETSTTLDLDTLTWDDRGLVPVIAQDITSGAVLMMAWADREAITKTRETGLAHFWSRSRKALWQKGETSGNVLQVEDITADCDRDTLLYRVVPTGPACHRGTRTCFEPNPARFEIGWLWQILEERRGADPDSSYTAKLLSKGLGRIAQKVGEEGVETVIAALTGSADDRSELVAEASDLVYHLLVLLMACDVEPEQLSEELRSRHRARTAPAPTAPSSTAPETGESP